MDRIILKSIEDSNILRSFGMAIYARKTQRTLLVQRKHSNALIMFLKGTFRRSYIYHFMLTTTREERNKLAEMLRSSDMQAAYFILYFEVFNKTPKISAYPILKLHAPYILYMCRLLEDFNLELEWTFPKGRTKYTECNGSFIRENSLCCAKREFLEETGIRLENITVSKKEYVVKSTALNGRPIHCTYWIGIVEDEITPNVIDTIEVARCEWKSLLSVLDLVSEENLVTYQNILSDMC